MATTTAEAIRDRCITVISAVIPTFLRTRFVAYRNEGEGDFSQFSEANPAGALRRFQVRTQATDRPVEVSNSDLELHYLDIEVRVAYPQNARAGKAAALDRDDIMDQDRHAIERAIGLSGAANFTSPWPDATWRSASVGRDIGNACDYLVIRQTMSFTRVMT